MIATKVWKSFLLMVVSFLILAPFQAKAAEQELCLYQFRKKLYLRAARCFQSLVEEKEKKGKLNSEQRSSVGSLLRNASLSLRKAANLSKQPEQSTYLREQALHIIEKVLAKKYYEDQAQKRLAEHIKEKLKQRIAYIQVTIVTHNPKTRIKLSGGYKFSPRQKVGNLWQMKLRHGNYSLVVQYPKQALQVRQLSLPTGLSNLLIKFFPHKKLPKKKPSQQTNIVSWILMGGGIVLGVVGGSLVGVAINTKNNADLLGQSLQEKKRTQPNAIKIAETLLLRDQINEANTQLTAGMLLGIGGISLVATGLVLFKMPSQTKKTPAPPVSSKKKRAFFSLSKFQ